MYVYENWLVESGNISVVWAYDKNKCESVCKECTQVKMRSKKRNKPLMKYTAGNIWRRETCQV